MYTQMRVHVHTHRHMHAHAHTHTHTHVCAKDRNWKSLAVLGIASFLTL